MTSKSLKFLAWITCLLFIVLIIYKLWPAWNSDSIREEVLLETLDQKLLRTALFSDNELEKYEVKINWLDQKRTKIVFNDSLVLSSDSLKFEQNQTGGETWLVYNTKYFPKPGQIQYIETALERTLNFSTNDVQYGTPLRINDMVNVNLLSFSSNIDAGKSVKLVTNGWWPGDTTAEFNSFLVHPQEGTVSVSSKSINWEILFIYVIVLFLMEFFLLYVLPRIGIGLKTLEEENLADQVRVDQIFRHDIETIKVKKSELYNRSSLMLVCGIIVAFVGVLVFAYTLDDPNHFRKSNGEFDSEAYFLHSIRPAMMLIFLEFLAIYLLRQYRALIQDFKYFHSIYLVRTDNYMIYKIIKMKELESSQKQVLIEIMNNRSERLNWLTLNDLVSNGQNSKELKAGLINVTELLKLLKDK